MREGRFGEFSLGSGGEGEPDVPRLKAFWVSFARTFPEYRRTMATPFQYQHRVTYAECAPGNHIYHARYLDVLEAARGEYFRELGHPLQRLQDQGWVFLILEARLRYLAPARYDDLLAVQVWPTFATGVRFNFAYRILLPGGQVSLEAETFQVCAGLNEKPKRPPAELMTALEERVILTAT